MSSIFYAMHLFLCSEPFFGKCKVKKGEGKVVPVLFFN
jgi:hypothetical protein